MRAVLRYLEEVGSALSRLLNALMGGDGSVTFSARCWALRLDHPPICRVLVWLVDAVNVQPGHCRGAWEWHRARDLM
ncbi:hypothetical protein UFOVP452_40 [uncultured Caudovirales phage]|uniref:Uncharacterized protein n=1 Tax=uncultured Caudovirales phage TaxID=2100421 RepID=A0A6J5M9L7_9CAUD|nr:hypothetical protein UFOVP452_40 [uncultured Caudovirales phage]